MSTADKLLDWLVRGPGDQRDKVASLPQHVATVRAMFDDDFERVVRAIRKHINNKRLAGQRDAVLAALAIDRAPNPRPVEPIAAPPPEPVRDDTEDALVATLLADPDNREAAAVYGDLLEARGDPRGRLIAIGNELAKRHGDRELVREHQQHLASHPALMGALWDCDDVVTQVEWSRGWIRKCRVALTLERFNLERPIVDIVDVVRWLVDDPGPGRFVQDLVVGIVTHDGNTYEGVAKVLAARPRALRSLFLGDFTSDETELNWSTIGDISALWPALPHLRELTLRSGSMTLGSIALPRLERLTTITGGMDAAALAAITGARWPAMQALSLQIGRTSHGATDDIALVEPILAGDRFPSLTALGLVNCEMTDEICARLPSSNLLPRLTSLDLSMGTMTDAGAEILLANVRGLDVLDVSQNYLSWSWRERLFPCAHRVIFDDQRHAGSGRRYAAAYE